MTYKLSTLTTLLTLLVSLLIMPGALAEEPEPGFPVGVPMEPRRSVDGKRYKPADATSSAGFSVTSPADTGGPDEFGYTWDDSVAFNWIDAKSLGTNSNLYGGDVYVGPIDIGFAFKFYENSYSQLYFSTKGLLSFGRGGNWWSNTTLPHSAIPNNIIVPFWDDLGMYKGTRPDAGIYTYQGGTAPNRYFVVEWYRADRYSGEVESGIEDADLTFEVILYENGDIVMQYLSLSGDLNMCSVGIEDDVGGDGLEYLYYEPGLGNNKAVRFYRPGPTARLKIWPLYYGQFASAGGAVFFKVPIRNIGELGADTYDLTTYSSWPVSFYDTTGAPLSDTDSDGAVDTGSVAQGSSKTIVARVKTPAFANVGDANTVDLLVRSSLDTGKSKMVDLRTSVPAPFAQVYRDDADGAMSLELVRPNVQTRVQTTSDGYWGYGVAVAEMPTSFAYVWYKGRSEGSVLVAELEYTLLDSSGSTTRAVSKLTDHSGVTYYTYDYSPAVAVAPNGNIGVIWYRYLYNPSNDYWNYNIYYAVLNSAGNVVVSPTNLTNDSAWGYG